MASSQSSPRLLRSRGGQTSTLDSPRPCYRSQSRRVLHRRRIKSVTREHEMVSQPEPEPATEPSPEHHQNSLHVGDAVAVFSYSAARWVDGEVVKVFEDDFLWVEYGVGREWCGKTLSMHSEDLIVPSISHPCDGVWQKLRATDSDAEVELSEVDPEATGVIRDLSWYTNVNSIWEVLRGGDVVLIKGLWLLELGLSHGVLPCRQELPSEAIWDIEELKQQFHKPNPLFGKPLIVAISHCWHSVEHPDPQGSQLQDLCPFIAVYEGATSGLNPGDYEHVAVFWAYCSLYQPRRRTPGGPSEFLPWQEASRRRALQNMHFWYAHECIHTWCHTKVMHGIPGYYERGWPTWELSVSLLITGLGSTSATFFYHGACVLDVCAISSDACRRSYNDLIDQCQMIRQPPLTPEQFNDVIEKKVFTARNADLPLIKEKYTQAFSQILGNAQILRYRSLGWGVQEMRQLCQVLPFCHNLEELDLSDNCIEADGCRTLAGALPDCSCLRTLRFADNPAMTGRGILRERCPNLKIYWAGNFAETAVRAVQGHYEEYRDMVIDAATAARALGTRLTHVQADALGWIQKARSRVFGERSTKI
eukprot:TRINITY_DN157_c0_g1_i1.p1 TRINITY_DN157_c0_g1~~TRINITY_DN157_c0_g1_i1.p1  ORF type:complete len:590 (+),score=59.31 TRINITY_DN157_c0_g1_i1:70-1839(+)